MVYVQLYHMYACVYTVFLGVYGLNVYVEGVLVLRHGTKLLFVNQCDFEHMMFPDRYLTHSKPRSTTSRLHEVIESLIMRMGINATEMV